MIRSWYPKENEFKSFSKYMSAEKSRDIEVEIPETISQWLSELILLYNIPFQYLVINEELLEENSIKFFHLNPNWILSLMDGATSLGRNGSIDISHDDLMIEYIYNKVYKECQNIRPVLQGKKKRISNEAIESVTGFIMRSALVKGWRGLEFKAYDEDMNELVPLRIETLSTDVLLGLYNGQIHKIDIAQPPESFHFAFDEIDGEYEKKMRSLEDGKLIDTKVKVKIKDKLNRVVDIKATVDNMSDYFHREFTSAEFALEMIKNPYVGRIESK